MEKVCRRRDDGCDYVYVAWGGRFGRAKPEKGWDDKSRVRAPRYVDFRYKHPRADFAFPSVSSR